MICLNFYGGAGVGKSTLAASVYAKLKQKGIRTELVGEYAKELCYENSMRVIADQLYLFAEQEHRMRCLRQSGVDIAVCDSPLLLNVLYDRDHDESLAQLIWARYHKYRNLNFLLRRDDSFFTEHDRIDTLDSAHEMDKRVRNMLLEHHIPYMKVAPDDAETVVRNVINQIALQNSVNVIP